MIRCEDGVGIACGLVLAWQVARCEDGVGMAGGLV